MRSRSSLLEGLARTGALVCLGVLLLISFRREGTSVVLSTTRGDLRGELARVTRVEPSAVHVALSRVPTRAERDWITALRRTSHGATWSATFTPTASALAADVVPGPYHETSMRVLVPTNVRAAVYDAQSLVDTIRGTSALVGTVGDRVEVRGDSTLGVSQLETLREHDDRRILVLGRASWETKFIIASLEEAGWTVSSEQYVTSARGEQAAVVVRSGMPIVTLDTNIVRAVVIVDAIPVSRLGLRSFVRAGGGLVICGGALSLPELQEMLPARTVRSERGDGGTNPLRAIDRLILRPVADGVGMDAFGSDSVLALRRVALGRVLLVGLTETWRWRMQSSADSVSDMHRRWWSRLVSSVAATRASRREPSLIDDPLPAAALAAALGSASPAPGVTRTIPDWWQRLLFATLVLLLLVEWYARRLRGAR